MQTSSFNVSANFNQSDSNLYLLINRFEAVVEWFKTFDWFNTSTYIENYSNRKRFASTLQNLYEAINVCCLFWRLFD